LAHTLPPSSAPCKNRGCICEFVVRSPAIFTHKKIQHWGAGTSAHTPTMVRCLRSRHHHCLFCPRRNPKGHGFGGGTCNQPALRRVARNGCHATSDTRPLGHASWILQTMDKELSAPAILRLRAAPPMPWPCIRSTPGQFAQPVLSSTARKSTALHARPFARIAWCMSQPQQQPSADVLHNRLSRNVIVNYRQLIILELLSRSAVRSEDCRHHLCLVSPLFVALLFLSCTLQRLQDQL